MYLGLEDSTSLSKGHMRGVCRVEGEGLRKALGR